MGKWLVKDVLLLGGLLLIAALSVVGGIGSALDVEYLREHGWLGFSLGEWVFYVLGVSFWMVVIPLLVRLRCLETARPSIIVTHGVHRGSGEISLEVHNKGATAQFKAQVQLLDGGEYFEDHGPYLAYWEQSRDANATISGGHSDRIRLGAVDFGGHPHMALLQLRLYFYDSVDRGNLEAPHLNWFESSSWMHGAEPAIQKPWCTVRVVISSEPQMVKGASNKTYKLDLMGGIIELPHVTLISRCKLLIRKGFGRE